MQSIRLVTFNIAHGRGLVPYQGMVGSARIRRNLLKIASLLHKLKPDVVALQEVDFDSHWNYHVDHLEFLRVHAEFPHSAMGVTNTRLGRRGLNYGNGLLSRFPIRSHATVPFGRAQIGGKGFLFAEIDVGRSHLLPIVNLHLDYKSRDSRMRQIDRLFDFVEIHYSKSGNDWLVPPVYCGDLNNPPHRPDATLLLSEHVARHGNYSVHPADGQTFPSPWPVTALDFVFLPPACRNAHSQVVRSFASDHRPVQVEFTLPGGREH
ncbi:MAG TPA: endonuclease/exonuclease/phosphatase family protein [Opitutaceae bacterium]|nr:endonuclease/exonuclease/phosphatase family protein [Opitutaceae bacterium]